MIKISLAVEGLRSPTTALVRNMTSPIIYKCVYFSEQAWASGMQQQYNYGQMQMASKAQTAQPVSIQNALYYL